MKNVYLDLPRPFFALAPMEGVTDTAFRQLVDECGRLDLKYTEFVNATGMFSRGSESVLMSLDFKPGEKPLIAQLWGTDVVDFEKGARRVVEMGYDGVDINMGCPVRKIVNKGSCSALINNEPLAGEIIAAVKRGADGKIPVSVKTRIGVSEIVTERWVRFLLEQGIEALILHGRTAAEMSLVPCHWDEIGKAVAIRNEMGVETVIIGNGDVESVEQGRAKAKEHGVDGVMIGRGVLHNPWVFSGREFDEFSREDKIKLLRRHVELFYEAFPGDRRPFVVLRRFFKIYLRGFAGAGELRDKVMSARDWEEVAALLD